MHIVSSFSKRPKSILFIEGPPPIINNLLLLGDGVIILELNILSDKDFYDKCAALRAFFGVGPLLLVIEIGLVCALLVCLVGIISLRTLRLLIFVKMFFYLFILKKGRTSPPL